MTESEVINSTLTFIQEQAGVSLALCDHFTGLRYSSGKVYFNVVLNKPCFVSDEFDKLKRISGSDSVIKSVEENGYRRLAICIQSQIN